MKKLLQLLAFIVMLPTLAQAQRTCPTLYSRNNGNNAPSDCPGAGGTFDQAAGFASTPYAYTSCCSSLTKTGAFFMKWTSSVAPTYVPAIKNIYIDGAVATTIMGPASSFDSITTTGKKAIKYCFYTVNLPNASKFALEFVNPLNDTLYSTCSYTWSGSGDIEPTTPPTVTGNPVSQTKCVGSSMTFTMAATPTTTVNTLTYQWRKNGVAISGATSSSYTLPSVALTDSGYYYCVVLESNTLAYNSCTSARLTVLASPTLTSASNNGPICAGSTLNLTANGPSGVTTYAWAGPVAITNSATANASVPSAATGASGTYSVTVSNGTCGQTYTTTATVNTNANVSNFSNPTVGTACTSSGASVTINSTSIASGTYTVSYNLTGANVSSNNTVNVTVTNPSGGSFTIPAARLTSVGSTTVTLTNIVGTGGCSSSISAGVASATFSVAATPSSVSANASPTSLCVGTNLTLTSSATNATSYSWAGPGGFTVTGQNPAAFAISTSNAGVFTVTATSACGSATATSSSVTVNNTPTSVSANASPSSLCAGSALTLTSSATNATSYSWAGPGGYTATGQNPSAFSMSVSNEGVYTVTATNSCGSTTATTSSVTVNTTPSISSANVSATTLCAGNNLTLTSSATGATSYSWAGPGGYTSTEQNPSAFAVTTSNAGIYTVTATNSCGSTTATTSAITVNTTSTSVSANASSSSLCSGANLTLTSAATGATSYSWAGPGGYTSTGQNPSAFAVTTSNAGIYTVSATNSCGSSTATTSAVTVNTTPTSVSANASSSSLCSGANLTLTSAATGATSYSWAGPGGYISTGQNPSAFAVTTSNAGIYTVSATNSCGSTTATTSSVTVNTTSTSVSANASPTSFCSGANLTLTSSGTGATSYSWTGPGGYTSTSQNPSAFAVTTSSAGIYTVSATNSCGSTTATTSSVTVITIPTSVFANASPSSLCSGANLTLTSSATGATSYSWSGPGGYASTSQNPSAFAVTTSNAGIYTVSATNSCGSTTATTSSVTVNTTPTSVSANASPTSLCSGANLTLTSSGTGATSYSWAGPGGYTSTGQNPSAFAVTTSNAGIYTVSATNSCGSTTATTSSITVNPTPDVSNFTSPSAGNTCLGGGTTVTVNSSTLAAGTYTATYSLGGNNTTGASTATLTMGSGSGTFSIPSGSLTNAGATTVTISSISAASGCSNNISSSNTAAFNVIELPNAGTVSGASTLNVGATITLSSTESGGTWSSSNTSIATVGTSGIVSGVSTGTATISYSYTNACGTDRATAVVTVNSLAPITGPSSVLVGSSITLADATSGGVWSSSNNTVATIGTNGVVTAGTTTGAVTITYTVGGAYVTYDVTVNPILPITGPISVLVGNSITLADATFGGVWSSSNNAMATIGTNGVVTAGTTTGVVTLTYTVGGAYVTYDVTVNPIQAITGPSSVLVGNSMTLADATSGGVWSSSNNMVATIGTNGVVTAGTTTGVVTFTYTVGGAYVTYDVTVNPIQPITGPSSVLVGNSITLADATSGGVWSSSNTSVATIGTNGVVAAGTTIAGVVTLTYTVGGAYVTYDVTVNPIQPITGPSSVLVGNSITLADATSGGVWSSSNASVATIGTNGVVEAGTTTTGVVTITYTVGGAYVTYDVTVNPIQSITGPSSVLVGNSSTLADATPGGVWSSSNNTMATIGTNGVVTAGTTTTGVVTITYTVSGAYVAYDVTVNPIQPITGPSSVLVGNSITLADATPGGVWSSSNNTVATIGTNGVVTAGATTGVVTITYTVAGAYVTYDVTVNSIQSITGPSSVLIGNSITLADATSGGVWSSSNASVATIGTNGVVTAGTTTTGVVTITYTVGGAYVTYDVTVNSIQAITGPSSVLVGNSMTLADATPGGVWSSSNNTVAIIGTNGVVTAGTTTGVVTLTYTVGGAYVTYDVTVNPIQAITGPSAVLVGNSITLADATSGGIWSSSNTSVATIGTNGVVTAGTTATGVVTLTYTVGGAYVTYDVTVNPILPITGPTQVIAGATITLEDATLGGAWSASEPAVATIGSDGLLTGVTPGTVTITYTIGGGRVTRTITVNPLLPITGAGSVCVGSVITLSDATPAGSWNTSDATVATVNSGIVEGVAAGTATISYTVTGVTVTRIVTVNDVAAIIGSPAVCASSTITLSNATSGGTWTSVATSVATIGSTNGVVSGMASGATDITYTSTAGCKAITSITVNPMPSVASISGTASVCQDMTTTLSNTTSGGAWSSNNASVAAVNPDGVVEGVASGNAIISYLVTNSFSCTTSVSRSVTVNALPTVAAISGTATACAGMATTLTNTTTGGVWTSSTPSIATIGSSTGIVAGISNGTSSITYTMTSAAGCVTAVNTIVTVTSAPAITGSTALCTGQAATLSNSATDGTWSSSNNARATIGSATGIISPISFGTATITYTQPTGCYSTIVVSVNIAPTAIIGNANICVGASATYSDATGGGFWSASNPSVADVDPSGVVASHAVGTSTITYSMYSGCNVIVTATVNPYPAAITGATMICTGNNITLSDATSGGTWSSSDVAIATIGSASGVVMSTGIGTAIITYTSEKGCSVTTSVNNPMNNIVGSQTMCTNLSQNLEMLTTGGTWTISDTSIASINSVGHVVARSSLGGATVTYTLPSGCYRTLAINVVSAPSAITGSATVCPGQTISLATATTGGYWRGEVGTDKVDGPSDDGHILGIAPGVATVTYALSPTCYVLHTITVNPLPQPITGISQICQSNSTSFANITSGGTWLTSNSSIASVSPSTGLITGMSGGTATISYMLSATGCFRTKPITINSTPPSIGGTKYLCVGSTTMLSDAATTPLSWTSSDPSVATIAPTGLVAGVSSGTANITFTTGSLCYTTSVVTVQSLPAAISGPSTICPGSTAAFSSADLGGTWTSSNTSLATVDPTFGDVTGVGPGVATITYTYGSLGCKRTKSVTVNPVPVVITGSTSACVGAVTTLSNAGTGGTWSSSDVTIATVGATNRVVTGIAPGTVTITNTLSTGCTASVVVTVIPTPAAITGSATISAGSTVSYTNSVSGGIWSSSNTTLATVDAATGEVNALVAGNVVLTYTIGTGCYAVKAVVVSAINPIVGNTNICQGGATTLSCGTAGGSWSSSDATVATIGSSTGIVSGLAAGTTTITYMKLGTYRTTVVTVNAALTAITGSVPVCSGNTFTLSNAVAGGTWSSNNLSVATVGSSSGIVTGIGTGGTSTVTYTIGAGCATTTSVTVYPNPAAITGTSPLCEGMTRTVNSATFGGTWSVSNATIAAVDPSTGFVSALVAGVTTITYTVPTGCFTTAALTVNELPATITGTAEVCVNASTTLGNATPGGTWSNNNPVHGMGPSTTGVVTGLSVGTTVITYSGSNGCARYTIVTINPLPAGITGITSVCPGLTTTLSDATSGGTWSADLSAAGIATINTSGVVSGIGAGTAVVSYTIDHGCYMTKVVTVSAVTASITGVTSVCPGGTTMLSCASSGGTSWTSSNTSVATIASSGAVTGVAAGTATITFTLGSGCISTTVVTVNPIPTAIAGVLKACPGITTTLSNTVSGGAWTSSNASVVVIDPSTGIATGVAAGNATITYTAGVGCYKTATFTVNTNPGVINGSKTICMGTSVTLSCAPGTWSSGNTAIATAVVSGGYVTSVAVGTTNITFTATGTGCYSTAVVTVIPVPSANTGTAVACVGQATSLANSTDGGTWSSANTAVASVGSTTGVVTGVGQGTILISYTINSTCRVTTSYTVRALPAAISGTPSVCMPVATTISDATSGGTWSSSNTSVATIGTGSTAAFGVITGLSAGTTVISFTLTATGCARTTVATVSPGPNPGVISSSTGIFTLRLTSAPTATLSSSGDAGGTWSSSNNAIATVNSITGLVTAVATGNVTITYSVTSGCTNIVTRLITVAAGRDGNNTIAGSDAPGIRLYPNPTSGAFSLASEEAGALQLFSMDGKEIMSYSIANGTNPLSLPQGLASGIYMCKFTGESGNTTMVRLVYEQ